MEYQKKVSVGGNFAKKGVDIKKGDTITIKSEGEKVEGKFGTQDVFKIGVGNEEFVMTFNQTSINSLIDKWGIQSTEWVGKEVKVHAIMQNVAGKFIEVYYVAPEGFVFSENGFMPNSEPVQTAVSPEQQAQDAVEIPPLPDEKQAPQSEPPF